MVKDVFFCMVSVVAGKLLFYGFRRWFVLWFPSWQGTFLMVSVVVFVNGFRLLQDRGCLSDGNRNKNHQDVSVTN